MHEGSTASAVGPSLFLRSVLPRYVPGIERIGLFWEVSAGQNARK
jgi:hypothetical protein